MLRCGAVPFCALCDPWLVRSVGVRRVRCVALRCVRFFSLQNELRVRLQLAASLEELVRAHPTTLARDAKQWQALLLPLPAPLPAAKGDQRAAETDTEAAVRALRRASSLASPSLSVLAYRQGA